ncbi:MAG: hypothetical protein WAM66_02455 [Acidobacteriaceae bacterium]
MKMNRQWMAAALVLAVLAVAFGEVGSNGQQSAAEAQAGMSAADRAILTSRQAELTESAKIYGYNLAAGNWAFQRAPCAALPNTILLHYRRSFPDGAESIFTAVVPRSAGRVRIVPVLYHNATPFVQAAANPRNYALFNQLVEETGNGGASLADNRLRFSACYAELTGIDAGPLPHKEIGIAGAPRPTLHLDPQRKISHVTLATRANPDTYQVWSVSFNREGKVARVSTEDQSVNSGKPASTTLAENRVAGQTPIAQRTAVEPGWKYIPSPPDPPTKYIPPAPPPPEKTMPNP